ncbi:DUF4321 domain-containing protein [Anaerotalea alkaliphila]|uniref:DUF4321 domain-containing protein n=1 Tax=Anaerotalea alkaliphila TaxID=2662126 RepID=A0A7X5KPE1_9FIRM|nr:DUF4321 domain-containing protein [Anaerotalea alkaliphila]NDL67952.1 DUF4321 domain-containing protein [Anaerotalea alkaliphila]
MLELKNIGDEGAIHVANYGKGNRNAWAMFFMILSGIVLGGFLGHLAAGVSYLEWLGFGYSFGMPHPFTLDLKVVYLSIQILLDMNIASILGIVLAIFIYRKL